MNREPYRPRLTEAQKDRVMSLLAAGVSQKHIAERFGVLPEAIHRIRKKREAEGFLLKVN